MKHPARWIALAVAVVVVVLGVVLALNVGNDPQAEATDVPVARIARRRRSTSRRSTAARVTPRRPRGQGVIVNFWNTWCTPCLAELPALKEFWNEHRDDGDVAMVGIVRDSQMSTGAVADVRATTEGWTGRSRSTPGARAALDFAHARSARDVRDLADGWIVGYQLSEVDASPGSRRCSRPRGRADDATRVAVGRARRSSSSVVLVVVAVAERRPAARERAPARSPRS